METILKYLSSTNIWLIAFGILIVLWVYFFIYSYRHNVSRPWGFAIVFIGILVSGRNISYKSYDGIVLFPIELMFAVVLIGLLWNVNEIQTQLHLNRFRRILFFSIVGILLGFSTSIFSSAAKAMEYIQVRSNYTTFALIFVTIQASIGEEFLIRGYLLSYFRKFKFNPSFAVLLQALIFTILHLPRYSSNWLLLIIIFFFAILAGYITWKSDNLIPASCMHVVINLTAVAEYFLLI